MALRILLTCLLVYTLHPVNGQRGVLLEKYTSAWCGQCPDANLTIQDLVEDYPTLIPVLHHSSVDGMGNPFSQEWREGFNVAGTPRGMVDRKGTAPNNISSSPGQWQSRIIERLSTPTVVDLNLNAQYSEASRELTIDVEAIFSEAIAEGDLRLSVMIVEDSVIGSGGGWDQSSYFNEVSGHPLEGLGNPLYNYPHRHVLREILDGTWGTAGLFPNVPEVDIPYGQTYQYTVPDNFREEQLRVVGVVSYYHESFLNQREVLNAAAIDYVDFGFLSSSEDLHQESVFRAFPNPTTGQVFIELETAVSGPKNSLIILDGAGRVMNNFVLDNSPVQTIDLSTYPAGFYVLQLMTQEGPSFRRIFLSK